MQIMWLFPSSLLLTGITTAVSTNMPRYLYPFVEHDVPFQAPRQDSPVDLRYVGQPCQYNSEYDTTISQQDQSLAETISRHVSFTIKVRSFHVCLTRNCCLYQMNQFPGKWSRRDSCLRWSVPNFYEGTPGKPVCTTAQGLVLFMSSLRTNLSGTRFAWWKSDRVLCRSAMLDLQGLFMQRIRYQRKFM